MQLYTLPIPDRVMEDVLNALVSYGRLSEREAMRRDALERALVDVITDVAARWRNPSSFP